VNITTHIATYIESRTDRINQHFTQFLPDITSPPAILHKAMHYAVINGGKRIRPLLLYATGETLGASPKQLDHAAAAIELIHAYSLIHDDLPAMDNAILRRGKPSCHKAFGEATAILAGDALLPLAFELIASTKHLNTEAKIEMISILTQASGSIGMVGGQVLDLITEQEINHHLDIEALTIIHQKKTGALFIACIQLGVIASRYSDKIVMENLTLFSKKVGLAYQIQDDILDIVGDTETLGKEQGVDAKLNKTTYPKIVGVATAREKVSALFNDALKILERTDLKDSLLEQLTHFIFYRNY